MERHTYTITMNYTDGEEETFDLELTYQGLVYYIEMMRFLPIVSSFVIVGVT